MSVPTLNPQSRRCGTDDYVLIRTPRVMHHVGDLYFKNDVGLEENPWRLELFDGIEMSITQGHMEHIYFDRKPLYYATITQGHMEHIYFDRKPLYNATYAHVYSPYTSTGTSRISSIWISSIWISSMQNAHCRQFQPVLRSKRFDSSVFSAAQRASVDTQFHPSTFVRRLPRPGGEAIWGPRERFVLCV